MAQTIPDITITGAAWVDVNTASGVAVGALMDITNKGIYDIRLYEGTTPPSTSSSEGVPLTSMYRSYATARVPAGSLKIWAKCSSASATSYIVVQEL